MGGGLFFALGGDTAALGHRETDRSLHVYLGHRAGPEWIETLGPADGPAARAEVLALLADWAPSLRALVEHADTAFTPRRVHALPVGHSWPRVPGVTLLGDAAHVMSPFAGEGANLALLDGAELALAVAAHPQDREGALAAYEAELFPRSADAARESADNLEVMFAPDAPRGLLEMFSARDDLA
jgi:2-polyprenyl-6-methoxyphenol hydroxylase-like FAD-dependent oxidoreductase